MAYPLNVKLIGSVNLIVLLELDSLTGISCVQLQYSIRAA